MHAYMCVEKVSRCAVQAWQVGLGLGKVKARRLYQSLAHWRGRSLRTLWGFWRTSVQETSHNLARAEAHWLAAYRFVCPCMPHSTTGTVRLCIHAHRVPPAASTA